MKDQLQSSKVQLPMKSWTAKVKNLYSLTQVDIDGLYIKVTNTADKLYP